MKDHFFELADELGRRHEDGEVILASFSGEESDFTRFSRSRVRQAGSVRQQYLTIEVIVGRRHAKGTFALAGAGELDRSRLEVMLAELRRRLRALPEDPYLLYATEVHSSEKRGVSLLPNRAAVLADILAAGDGKDLVGIYAQGGIYAGFANTLGQRNWFETYSFHLDWTYYLRGDKAVKADYAGFAWNADEFAAKAAAAAEKLAVLGREPKTIAPGRYRVYLAPAALAEFVGFLGWGGFGLKDHRTKNTCLLRMIEEGVALSDQVTLCENVAEGLAPNFQSAGFVKPDWVTLIERGELRGSLVSPRSAQEYGVPTTGAREGEVPESLDLAAGGLPAERILAELGTGLYVGNLWYLNYSDRPGGRVTGLTRFGTFWVEGGEFVCPVNVMRFDETIYRALGEKLVGLTREREFRPDAGTYGGRSTSSFRVPGALIDDFTLTL